jgi:hypothetical protein
VDGVYAAWAANSATDLTGTTGGALVAVWEHEVKCEAAYWLVTRSDGAAGAPVHSAKALGPVRLRHRGGRFCWRDADRWKFSESRTNLLFMRAFLSLAWVKENIP